MQNLITDSVSFVLATICIGLAGDVQAGGSQPVAQPLAVAQVAADSSKPASELETPDAAQFVELEKLVSPLAAADFKVRQSAIQVLQELPADQVALLGEYASRCRDAEVAGRIIQLLETFFAAGDDERGKAAGEALERASLSQRWMVAEAASEVLDRNWERRLLLTVHELQQLGVSFSPADPSVLWGKGQTQVNGPGPGGFPFDRELLQINISKAWNGGSRGIELLQRLGPLAGSQQFGDFRMIVYLIDGHPLKEEEVIQLRGAFSEGRVQTRGRVCLGITNNIFVTDEMGCRVGQVRPETSAHLAGIQENDLITHLEDQPIRDFDHLVDSLRKYDVGDKVRMRIRRDGSMGRNRIRFQIPLDDPENQDLRGKEMEIEVELKGWN